MTSIDHKIRVLSLDSDDESSSELEENKYIVGDDNHQKILIERKIYLKAALKLLDERDQSLDEKIPNRCMVDVIKYGVLKKITGNSVTRSWKDKFVELRHGVFTYGDYSGWNHHTNWKKIKLLSQKIRCYPLKSGNIQNKFIFVLKEINGSKRLWMVDTNEEMISWIESIKTAMIGSAGDFTEDIIDYNNDNINIGNDLSGISGNDNFECDSISSPVPIQLWHHSESFTQSSSNLLKSFNGLPSSLSSEIKRYIFLQTAIINTHSASEYRDLLELYTSEPHFTIPISFIKHYVPSFQKLNQYNTRKFLKNDNKKKFILTENSQAWKDLHRDIMVINGEKISGGEHGPESMLGELVRIILSKVQEMRNRYITNLPINSTKDIDILKKKNNIFGDLDESQALSCSRDILLSCNRTESGGDTYFAIESLLVNKEFAVLTPFASEEEPLEIIVDIVERKTNHQDKYEFVNKSNIISDSSEILNQLHSNFFKNDQNINNNNNNNNNNIGTNTNIKRKSKSNTISSDNNNNNNNNNNGDTIINTVNNNNNNNNNNNYNNKMRKNEINKLRIGDDCTDSSGLTFSVSTGEDESNQKSSSSSSSSYYHSNNIPLSSYSKILNQNLVQDNGLNYVDTSDLAMPSDIIGATAIQSSVLLSKNIKRKNKDISKKKSYQYQFNSGLDGSGSSSISDSSNYFDNSFHTNDDLFIPDTSHEETSESAEECDRILSNSFDSNESPIIERIQQSLSPTLSQQIEQEDDEEEETYDDNDNYDEYQHNNNDDNNNNNNNNNNRIYKEIENTNLKDKNHSKFNTHYNHNDDMTVDISEVTLDSALKLNNNKTNKKTGAFSKAMKFVSPMGSKSKKDKGLFGNLLKRDMQTKKIDEYNNGINNNNNNNFNDINGNNNYYLNSNNNSHNNSHNNSNNNSHDENNSFELKRRGSNGSRKNLGSENNNHNNSLLESDFDFDMENDNDNDNSAALSMCIRIQVIAKSKYRLCNLDPQNDTDDNWAIVNGSFRQVFFLKSNSNGRPSISDRLVTIKVASIK